MAELPVRARMKRMQMLAQKNGVQIGANNNNQLSQLQETCQCTFVEEAVRGTAIGLEAAAAGF